VGARDVHAANKVAFDSPVALTAATRIAPPARDARHFRHCRVFSGAGHAFPMSTRAVLARRARG